MEMLTLLRCKDKTVGLVKDKGRLPRAVDTELGFENNQV